MNTKNLGKLGENIAEKFLTNQLFKTLEKNYRWRGGEIDLIMLKTDPEPSIVFVEVKTRTNNHFGELTETLDKRKIIKLIKTAHHFILFNQINPIISWRIDLITVKLNLKNLTKEINHYKYVDG